MKAASWSLRPRAPASSSLENAPPAAELTYFNRENRREAGAAQRSPAFCRVPPDRTVLLGARCGGFNLRQRSAPTRGGGQHGAARGKDGRPPPRARKGVPPRKR